MVSKKTTKGKTVSKEIKEVKDQRILEKSDTKRERRSPVRFSVAVAKTATRELVIPKGKGAALGDIPEIAAEISSRKMTDRLLMTLHHLAFGMATKRIRVKSNLRSFCGVKYDDKLDRAKLEQRIQARSFSVLRDICSLLHLSCGGGTADLVVRVADFLECPKSSGTTETKKRAKPAAKKPATKKPAAKKAAAKKPAEKKPAAKKPAAKKPAEKKAKTEKKPVEKKAASPKKAAAKKPAAKKTTKAAAKK